MFFGKCILKNFAKFTRKHLHYSLFFNKVAGLRPEERKPRSNKPPKKDGSDRLTLKTIRGGFRDFGKGWRSMSTTMIENLRFQMV